MTTSLTPVMAGRDDDRDAVAVVVSDLVKTYRDPEGGTFNAVNGLSFDVKRGEVFGFLGPNGAGKSTTLEIIEGLTQATSGSTNVLGMDSQQDSAAMKQRIGVQLQASSYFEYLTLEELLELFGELLPTVDTVGRPPGQGRALGEAKGPGRRIVGRPGATVLHRGGHGQRSRHRLPR